MKYETPELTALTPAINAIQSSIPAKLAQQFGDSPNPSVRNEHSGAYEDWE
jgi:hypothetical protein